MTFPMRLLVVEDEAANVKLWDDQIAIHNAQAAEKGYAISMIVAKTLDEARATLRTHRIDAAVVDLRLSQVDGGGHNADGNNVVRLLSETEVATVAVLTGARQEADFEEDLPLVSVFDRGDGLTPVFQWLSENAPLMSAMVDVRKLLSGAMAKLFHQSIWPRWRQWKDGSGQEMVAALARHASAHVHEAMLHTAAGKVHPEESYFLPPIGRVLSTGDLLVLDKDVYIVITPRCDLAQTKNDTIQMALCEDISTQWKEKVAQAQKLNKAAQEDIKKMKQHDRKANRHFLPPMLDLDGAPRGPWFVRFDSVLSIPGREGGERLTKTKPFATLSPQFLPSLVERLGAYFSRIGTPDL